MFVVGVVALPAPALAQPLAQPQSTPAIRLTNHVPVPTDQSAFGRITITAVQFDTTLNHNIPNLNVTHNRSHTANFLDFYSVTGGITRWGLPTSEVFEESPGVLVQYYQRGVVTWKASLNTPGVFTFQRVLAWDFIGGGLGGSVDQGVEPGFFNPNPGTPLGPWGHRVSNTSVEGVGIGFLDFFNSLGGVNSFGYPKTDARADLHPNAVLTRPGSAPAFIRQYFQAAVMEYHPDAPEGQRVKLALLGDTVRDLRYPNNAWQAIGAFSPASPLGPGQDLPRMTMRQ